MGKTGISRGRFPGQIRDPLIRSGNHSNRFRYRIRRIFPDFFPNPFFPEKMISGREFRYSVSVGTGISRSRFHPYSRWRGRPCARAALYASDSDLTMCAGGASSPERDAYQCGVPVEYVVGGVAADVPQTWPVP